MRTPIMVALLALGSLRSTLAQEPVLAAADPEALFTDADPAKHANKQVVLHILRELLQCNYWDQADRWLGALSAAQPERAVGARQSARVLQRPAARRDV
jgi:hypothetical protein